MAEARKATDASGKGLEEDAGGRLSNYKPKMPGNKRAGVGAQSRSSAAE